MTRIRLSTWSTFSRSVSMAWQDREREIKTQEGTQRLIGEVCMIWAAIDNDITELMMYVLETGPDQAAILNTALREVAPRCTVLERLLIASSYDEEWVDWLCRMLAKTRDDLSPRRNRYVHDRWFIGMEAMQKRNSQVKTPKPQSYQRRAIVYDEEEIVTVEKLQEWCFDGYDIHEALDQAIHDLRYWYLSERPLEAHKQDFLGRSSARYKRYGPSAS
ncbi:hypothetical protein [Sphingopyxis sp. DBS4]|uniref:hypothetical protein n=1 Tax=Sphingopyxis sp. DBS4 TaxID=2968500 RepID=UPI00214B671E|nr:hypothetical protein [Sphingopyxis sp. DBS4]